MRATPRLPSGMLPPPKWKRIKWSRTILRGTPIVFRVRIIRRGRFVNARDLHQISELCEWVRCYQQRLKWGEVPFVGNVEAMLKRKKPKRRAAGRGKGRGR